MVQCLRFGSFIVVGPGSIPSPETKILQVVQHSKKNPCKLYIYLNIFKYIQYTCVYIEYTYDGFFFFLTMPYSMWDLSSLTMDQTCAHCSGIMES